MVTTNNLSVC